MEYKYRIIKKVGNSGLAEICGERDQEKSLLGIVEGTEMPGVISDEVADYHVVSIGDDAFTCEKGLSAMTIPWGVITIGKRAFGGCENIRSVELPETLKVISEYAFSGCSELRSIELPEGLVYLGNSAFAKCGNLETVISKSELPFMLGIDVFENISPHCKLIVPRGSKEWYNKHGWTDAVFGGGIEEEGTMPVVESELESELANRNMMRLIMF